MSSLLKPPFNADNIPQYYYRGATLDEIMEVAATQTEPQYYLSQVLQSLMERPDLYNDGYIHQDKLVQFQQEIPTKLEYLKSQLSTDKYQWVLNTTLLESLGNDCYCEHLEWILNQGADVTCWNARKQTPLHLACSKNREDIELLLKKGADPSQLDSQYKSPMLYLLNTGVSDRKIEFQQVNKKLLQDNIKLLCDFGANINDTRQESHPLFTEHARHFDVLKTLISLGANTNVKNQHSRTPLLNVITKSDEEHNEKIIHLLLKQKPDLTHMDAMGNSVLMLAHHFQSPEMMQLLIEQGANVHVKNHIGNNLLFLKTLENNNYVFKQEHFECYLKNGIDINHQNDNGVTPLMQLMSMGKDDGLMGAKFLIGRGANPHLLDDKKRNALFYFLNPDEEHPFSSYFSTGLFQSFLEQGVLIDQQDVNGDTPLMLAAGRRNYAAIRALITAGANPNLKNNRGRDAVYMACNRTHLHQSQDNMKVNLLNMEKVIETTKLVLEKAMVEHSFSKKDLAPKQKKNVL